MTRSPLDRRTWKNLRRRIDLLYCDHRIDAAENMPEKGMNHIIPMICKRAEML